jgi:GNAT superfamily N-acetyltransferase
MHGIRISVKENRLTDPGIISEASYFPYIEKRSCWVAIYDGKIGGFAALDFKDRTVWALFVAPDMEGLGLGRSLHEQLIRAARNHGLKSICLATETGSRAARFYEAAGWKCIGDARGSGERTYEYRLAHI